MLEENRRTSDRSVVAALAILRRQAASRGSLREVDVVVAIPKVVRACCRHRRSFRALYPRNFALSLSPLFSRFTADWTDARYGTIGESN